MINTKLLFKFFNDFVYWKKLITKIYYKKIEELILQKDWFCKNPESEILCEAHDYVKLFFYAL